MMGVCIGREFGHVLASWLKFTSKKVLLNRVSHRPLVLTSSLASSSVIVQCNDQRTRLVTTENCLNMKIIADLVNQFCESVSSSIVSHIPKATFCQFFAHGEITGKFIGSKRATPSQNSNLAMNLSFFQPARYAFLWCRANWILVISWHVWTSPSIGLFFELLALTDLILCS